MADETTNTGGDTASNQRKPDTGSSNTPPQQEPEAHILEERIIAPAPKAPTPPTPLEKMPPLPEEKPAVPKVIVPPAPKIERPVESPHNTVPKTTVMPQTARQTQPPASQIPSIPKEPPISKNTVPTPEKTSVPPPAPAAASTPSKPAENQNMQDVLKSIKLPERRTAPGEKPAPQEPKKTFDTGLGKMLSDDNEKIVDNLSLENKKEAPKQQTAPNLEEKPRGGMIDNFASIVAPVRTLKDDFQDIVRDKKISIVRAASLEQEKRFGKGKKETDSDAPVRKSHHAAGIIFGAIVFALLGAAVFLGIAIIMQERAGYSALPEDSSLLFSELTVEFPIDNLSSFDVKSKIVSVRQGTNPQALGSIARIVPTVTDTSVSQKGEPTTFVRDATLSEFLRALGANPPDALVRALGSDFFFGIHTVDENAPVFVIPVTSYERAFAGMLQWEDNMNADLQPAFTSVPPTTIGPDGLLVRRQFQDLVMRNYDTRVLKDDSGTVQLFYTFPTRDYLIIAESPYSFPEILSRLRAERKI